MVGPIYKAAQPTRQSFNGEGGDDVGNEKTGEEKGCKEKVVGQ